MPIIKHELTAADAETMQGMRAMLAGMPSLTFGPESRPTFDAIMGQTPAPESVSFEQGQVGGVPGWWARPAKADPKAVILYLHGGGYVIGSAGAYRNFVGHIAAKSGAAAFVADYALAPERPFPAALADLRALHSGLTELGFGRIAICGDSAGGGLALSFLAAGIDPGQVTGIVAMSPWIDLSLGSDSMVTRAGSDPLLSKDTLASAATSYVGEANVSDARLATLDADLSALPPVRIHVGDAEVLLDDALRFAKKADDAGVPCEVHVWDGMIHVFPSNFAMLQAAAAAVDDIARFLADRLAPPVRQASHKKVLVLGATGGTGREIVRQLNKTGHTAVALVRSRAKAADIDAILIEGDARDPKALDRALTGCDAVISALGTPPSPFKAVSLLSSATQLLVTAMQRNGAKRLVCITGIGAGDSRGHGGFAFDNIIMPLLLRKVYADKNRQEAIIGASSLDWVVVRPAVLNDKPRSGKIRALTDLRKFHGGTISRSDVADFVTAQVDSNQYLGKKPLITW
ncbi:NAD(P)H-binding protein [Asticcacaulis benevestitus]|uniref:NAD(P)-binding domain-containing protein n=1 Tax=Asticcacaulis benevestitus DSM 16100 = ATCC BAA-896 TaxID=1121022 RepID=V4RNP5_9CAUL|nr:NAD(P)H-binding protein [Asticcacaulis benevestitus]ESQ92863.1 hypothetical protein ABENE_07100 [Asticcacaulis benevestitus DSM 16100 = ATCC BAA-896]